MRKVFVCVLLVAKVVFAQTSFSSVTPVNTAPSARFDPTIAYDSPGRQLFMFGGQDSVPRNDLWAFSPDSGRWTQLAPHGALPNVRFGHALVFDSVRRRLILFGGQAGTGTFFNDVQSYDIATNTWTQLAPSDSGPMARYGHGAIYDAARDRLVITHGFTTSGRFDDTWAFSLATNKWQDISPSGTRPLKRCLMHTVYDDAHHQMLMYAGCSSGFGPCPLDDLWSFDLVSAQWTELTYAPKPPARQWPGMAFDSARGVLVVFGGTGPITLLNDVWEYDTTKNIWTQITLSTYPTQRSRVGAVYVSQLGLSLYFGGLVNGDFTNELLNYGIMTPPAIQAGGVVNGASFAAGAPVAPGSIASAFGHLLALLDSAASTPLPATLGGTSLRFNATSSLAIPAPQFYASPGQINFQVPWELTGQSTASLSSSALAAQSVKLAAAAPGIFTVAGGTQGTIVDGQGRLLDASLPAHAGDFVQVYCTGLGDVSNRPASGAPPTALASTVMTVTATIGGAPAVVSFSGLAPGLVGLYQVNVQVPAGVTAGNAVAVALTVNGVTSNTVTMALSTR